MINKSSKNYYNKNKEKVRKQQEKYRQENKEFYNSRFPQRLFFPILRKSHSNNINIWIFFQQNIYLIAESIRWIDNVQEILNYLSVKDTNSHSTYNN